MAKVGKLNVAMIIGVFFLVGGIISVLQIPAPAWFKAVDLLFAYLPMAWLAVKVAGLFKKSTPDGAIDY